MTHKAACVVLHVKHVSLCALCIRVVARVMSTSSPRQVLRAANRSTKLLFLCSPGNPTGKSVPASVIRDIVKGGFDGMVVVDEAYVDFSGHDSACSLIDELDRVIVLQTLSKAFGMAAIRCVCVCIRLRVPVFS